MRFLLFLTLIISVSSCQNDDPNDATVSSKAEDNKVAFLADTMINGYKFIINDSVMRAVKKYPVDNTFTETYLKGNDAFLINYDNPHINGARIRYFHVDTIKHNGYQSHIILENVTLKSPSTRMYALTVDDKGKVISTCVLAIKEKTHYGNLHERSYIKNDTLHRFHVTSPVSAEQTTIDTVYARIKFHGLRRLELIDNKSWKTKVN